MKISALVWLALLAGLLLAGQTFGEEEAKVQEGSAENEAGEEVPIVAVDEGDVVFEQDGAEEVKEEGKDAEAPIADDVDATEEHISEAAIEEDIYAGDHIRRHPKLEHHVLFTSTGNETDFVVGDTQFMLTGLRNAGKSHFVVQAMEASLRLPQQWDYVLFNFTSRPVGTVVPPGAVASVEYPFRTHKELEGRDYGLTIIINYSDNEGALYRHAVFNGTVHFVEAKAYGNYQNTLLLLFSVTSVAAFVYGLRSTVYAKKPKVKRQPVEKRETGTVLKADASWLEGTNVATRAKSPKGGVRSPKSPK